MINGCVMINDDWWYKWNDVNKWINNDMMMWYK